MPLRARKLSSFNGFAFYIKTPMLTEHVSARLINPNDKSFESGKERMIAKGDDFGDILGTINKLYYVESFKLWFDRGLNITIKGAPRLNDIKKWISIKNTQLLNQGIESSYVNDTITSEICEHCNKCGKGSYIVGVLNKTAICLGCMSGKQMPRGFYEDMTAQ